MNAKAPYSSRKPREAAMESKPRSDANKRRKTDSFFYAERQDALDPALVHNTSPLEQENNILAVQDVGKQYQLAVKNYNIQVRDNRIKAKDERIAELEEDIETNILALAEMQRQGESYKEHMARQHAIGEEQANKIKKLMSIVRGDRVELLDKEDQIRTLQEELKTQKANVKELEDQRILDRALEWICEVLGMQTMWRRANSFPFLQLPAELRNNIYKMCLVAPRPIDLWPFIADDAPRGITRASILQRNLKTVNVKLLCTSRQVHREAIGIFYGCNRFRFSDIGAWTVLEGFLLNLNRNCQYLTNISVNSPDWFYTLCEEQAPYEVAPERAVVEMQPVLDRFGLTIDNPIGPSLHPVSAYKRVSAMMLRLTALRALTIIIEYKAQLYPLAATHLCKMLTDEDTMLYPDEKPFSTPTRTVVFLRRPEWRPRIHHLTDLDNNNTMGRSFLGGAVKKRGVMLKYGTYGKHADRVSYIVEDDEEEEYDVAFLEYAEYPRPGLLFRAARKLLGY